MNEPISTLMQRQVQVVDMDQTVDDIEALVAERKLHWAPVIDPSGDVIGVIRSASTRARRSRMWHARWSLATSIMS